MTIVKFHMLGPPSLTKDGRAIRLHSSKVVALLAYLVCRAETPHSRDALIALLWADALQSNGRQNLRQALYSLRRALGELADLCLVADRYTITFYPHPDFEADLLTFDGLVNQEPQSYQSDSVPLKDVELVRGSLLEGIVLADAPEFEEWLFLERERLDQQAIRLFQLSIDRLLANAEVDDAYRLGHRLVGLDNLNEGAHRRLMRIYAAQGNVDAAKRQYRLCSDILMSELGVEPTSKTTALYGKLVANEAETAALPQEKLPPVPARSTFHGCKEALAELSVSLVQAVAGQARLVFIRGEAGIGKTRTAEEFIRRSSMQRTARWLQGQCYEAESGSPYTMWSDLAGTLNMPKWRALLQDLPEVWQRQLAMLAPGLAKPSEPFLDLPSDESQLRLMQGVVQSLSHLADSGPLILFFDDIHWADVSSLELLHYAARHLLASPVLIIASYCPEMVIDNAHLHAVLDKPGATTIEIERATEEDASKMLSELEIPISPETVSRLLHHCGGNRFMLVETIRMLIDNRMSADELPRQSGHRRVPPVPPAVYDLIQSRLASLADGQRRVLATMAVIGRPCSLLLLRRVSGQPEMELVYQIEQLVRRAFLRQSTVDAAPAILDIAHSFVRQVIYDEMLPLQRQALHRRTAEALLTPFSGSRLPVAHEEIAYHYEQADHSDAFIFLQRAAEQAASLFALPHATSLYSRALIFADTHHGGDTAGRYEILLAREALLDQQGRRAEQEDDIVELLALADVTNNSCRLATILVRQAGYLSTMRQAERSLAVAKEALALYQEARDDVGEVRALRELGFLYWANNNNGVALDYGRSTLQRHRKLGDTTGQATALHNLAEIYRGLDSPRQALNHYEQALTLQWADRDHRRQGLTLYGMAHALRQLDDRSGALLRYKQALVQTEAAGDTLMTSRVYHALANLHAQSGDTEEAIEALQHAVGISEEIGYAPGVAHGLVGLSYLHALSERSEAAGEALHDAMVWFDLMDDQDGIDFVLERLAQLKATASHMAEPPSHFGWFKTSVALSEGKVYCEFESPLSR